MGLRYLATHQSAQKTAERIDKGTCFIALTDERLVETLTYYRLGRSKGSPWLEKSDIAHFGQFGVAPEFQRRGIGRLLIKRAEDLARNDKASEIALDTAEPAAHLIEWYKRLGYCFVEYADWDVTNYRSVIMSKRL